ncbi:DUF488 domain-containing protein [Chromohalobacter japonicus]|uniref:DUF488 domain-containing protein n=1 Tax=Chromohalobacter japonicus TaxID=223900 RepID=UPI001FF38B55|nr:DUF488 family protein [Chromohalobacter japonicus]MCK0753907.1 DUF488 family protein [Chromohalobacter japonicus]
MSYTIALKRIYQAAEESDGARVLVDRLWPRGKRRESLQLTDWYRDASPSNALRRAWHQGELNDTVFSHRYRWEVEDDPDVLLPLMRWAREGTLTLLTASREPQRSHLPYLRDMLLKALETEDREADDRTPASSPCYADQATPPHADDSTPSKTPTSRD